MSNSPWFHCKILQFATYLSSIQLFDGASTINPRPTRLKVYVSKLFFILIIVAWFGNIQEWRFLVITGGKE